MIKYIIEKKGKKYVKIGDKAIQFEKYDKHGKPIIEPKIIKSKNKKGGTDIKVKIRALNIKYQTNGNRII